MESVDEQEERKKELAANTPKVQVSIGDHDQNQQQQHQEDSDMVVDEQPPRACNGSCQNGEVDSEVYKIAREIQDVHISDA